MAVARNYVKLREAVPVCEKFRGQVAWQGVVYVFNIDGHLNATICYAWSSTIESSTKRRFFAVLHIPPVTSPQEAVRAAIVAEYKASNN